MKILVPTTDIRLGESLPLKGGARYVATDGVANSLASSCPNVIRLVADAKFCTRPWRGEDLTGKTLLVSRPLGLGDEFITARLCEIAKRRHNAARVLFSSFESHHDLWKPAAPLPFELLPSVVPFETWAEADYHVPGEHWWEAVATSDQPDCFDMMASVCGIQIPPEDAIPLIPIPPETDLAATAQAIDAKLAGKPMVLWQVGATSRIRSYPPEQTRKALALLLQRSDAAVVFAGHPSQIAEYEIQPTDRVAIYSAGIPGLIALAAVAARRRACVICPDSVLGHIAAVWPALPVVSLWASFDPASRVRTYINHRPIYNRIKCAPCWSHEHHGDPRRYQGCPLTACNDHCAGLRAIQPERVAGAIIEALNISQEGRPAGRPKD